MNTTISQIMEEPDEVENVVEEKKIPYPKSVVFIIITEFCERFCFYGIQTILAMYLAQRLNYSENQATVVFHVFTMLVYSTCLFGAILADSCLGKFKTILYLSILYAIGCGLTAIVAVPPLTRRDEILTIVGLIIIAFGSGGMRPCVAAFGGDQFKLPEQQKQMTTFFSMFYIMINLGSLLSTLITPFLRENVQCFSRNDCYILAIGLPGAVMCVAIGVFVFGKKWYTIEKPERNMLVLVTTCIWSAIRNKLNRNESGVGYRDHWLDYADPKFDTQLTDDIKVILKSLVFFIPMPIFWALHEQQGSRWTFQAARMDGDIGIMDIKPEQIRVLNPIFILICIPTFDFILYPKLDQFGLRRPLSKMVAGGILAALAFLFATILELHLQQYTQMMPRNNVNRINELNMLNTLPCEYTIFSCIPSHPKFTIGPNSSLEKFIAVERTDNCNFIMEPTSKTDNEDCPSLSGLFRLNEAPIENFYITKKQILKINQHKEHMIDREPELHLLTNFEKKRNIQVLSFAGKVGWLVYNGSDTDLPNVSFSPSYAQIYVDNHKVKDIGLRNGVVATIILSDHNGVLQSRTQYSSGPKTVNILWMLPQYLAMSMGEIMFSITGLSFSYSLAPPSMKSVMQAIWLLMIAFGNLIDILVIGLLTVRSHQAAEFILFGAFMALDMLLLMLIAHKYFPSVKMNVQETLI